MIPALPPTLKSWLLFAALATALGTGWTLRDWLCDSQHAAELQTAVDARLKAEQDANKKSTELEQQLAAERQKAGAIARRLNAETLDAAYRCPVPPHGLRLLREAVTSGDSAR